MCPPLVLRFWLPNNVMSPAALKLMPLPAPEAVMFAPIERFVDAPVETRLVEPVLVMDPVVEIVWHSRLTLADVEMVPDALFAKVPELQVTVRLERPLTAALTVTLPPVEVRLNELDELVEATAFETVMPPLLSMTAFLAVISETRSEARMLVAVAAFAWKTPSTNCPAVVPELVTVMEVATKVGVTESDVPTKASAVTVSVWAPVTPLWKPMSAKVATPPLEVTVTEVAIEVTPFTVWRRTVELDAVRVTCWAAPV
jgi:hypothetical protein